MADRTFDILIDIEAKVGAIDQAVQRIQQLNSETKATGDAFAGVLHGIQIGLGIDLVGLVSEIPAKLREAVEEGLRFNAFVESATIGVAGMLRQFAPERYQSFNAALGDSGQLLDLLRAKANQLGLSFEAMVEQYRTTAGALFAGGVTDLQKQVQLTVLLQQAVGSLGITGFQAQRDIFDLLEGRASRTIAGKALGVSDDDIAKAKEAGQLYEFLTDKFSALSESGKALGTTFSAAEQRAKNLGQQLAGIATQDVFAEVKKGLDELNTKLAEPQTAESVRAYSNLTLDSAKGYGLAFSEAASLAERSFQAFEAGAERVLPLQQPLEHLRDVFEDQGGNAGGGFLGSLLDTGRAEQFLTTMKQVESSLLSQVTSARSDNEQKQARATLDAAIEAAQKRVAESTGQTHDLAAQLLHDLENISAVFPSIVGSAVNVAHALEAAQKAADALAKFDSANLVARATLTNQPDVAAQVQASTAYATTLESLTKAGVSQEQATLRAHEAEQLILDQYKKETEEKKKSLAVSDEENAAIHLKAEGLTSASIEAKRKADIDRLTLQYQKEFNLSEEEARSKATQRATDEAKISQQKQDQKDSTLAERDARRQVTDLLREDSALLRSLQIQQRLISANPSLGVDAKQGLLGINAVAQQQELQTAIEKTGDALSKAFAEGNQQDITRLGERVEELKARFTELGFTIQQTGFGNSFKKSLADYVNGFGSAGQQAATALTGSVNAALQGTNQLLIGAATGTGDWRQALQGAESQVISLGLTLLEQLALKEAASLLGITTTTSAQVASGAAIAAAHAPAAAATSISSYGSAAIVGEVLAVAAIAAIIAALSGAFAEGGVIPGAPSRKDNRLIFAAAGEGILTSDTVQKYGGENFINALNSGTLTLPHFETGGVVDVDAAFGNLSVNSKVGGYAADNQLATGTYGKSGGFGSLGASSKTELHVYFDEREQIRGYAKSSAARKEMIKIVTGPGSPVHH